MEHMAKNIFREAAEKEGLTGKEAEGAVKEKPGIIPEAAYRDKAYCRPDILEILKRSQRSRFTGFTILMPEIIIIRWT